MPYHVTRIDAEGGLTFSGVCNEDVLKLDLRVTEIRVRHGEVGLFDEQGRESVLIQRGTYPGAGMSVNIADHVETR